MPTLHKSTTEAAEYLNRDGYSWAPALGAGVTLTYGFRETAPYWSSSHNEGATFSQCTDVQRASYEMIISLFADIANVTFEAVNPAGTTDAAVLLFANYDNPNDGALGFAFQPQYAITHQDSVEGDVWMQVSAADSQPLGYFNYFAMMHELGHAIGLDHPGAYNSPTGIQTYGADAEYIEDSHQFTMMSYFDAWATGATHFVDLPYNERFASTPLLHDIAAIQRLYGANMTTRTGDTVYGFNSTADRAPFDFTTNVDPIVAIWDAGGTHDVLDVSGYTNNQVIDLRAGAFSDIGRLTKNVAIAEGATIEDARGGSGNDSMLGNEVANILNGNAGNDSLRGLEGADTIAGGSGRDSLYGGIGNDAVFGGADDDVVYGGLGNDRLTGGAGSDAFVFNSLPNGATNRDQIVDFNAVDDVMNIENFVFKALGVATGGLAAGKFWSSSTGAAHDADDRIVYNKTTGVLIYDANGSAAGGAVALATLLNHAVITAADFLVI